MHFLVLCILIEIFCVKVVAVMSCCSKKTRALNLRPRQKNIWILLKLSVGMATAQTPNIIIKIKKTASLYEKYCLTSSNSRLIVGNCYHCDQRGSEGCSDGGRCRCKVTGWRRYSSTQTKRKVSYILVVTSQMNAQDPSCSSCKPGTFHLSQDNKDGCLSCFCMGVTQQCSSSAHYRDLVRSWLNW